MTEHFGRYCPCNNSPGRNTLFSLFSALCAVVAATAFGQIKSMPGTSLSTIARAQEIWRFGDQLWVFVVIAGALLALNARRPGSTR